jgi:hypothetical protein
MEIPLKGMLGSDSGIDSCQQDKTFSTDDFFVSGERLILLAKKSALMI